MPLRSSDAARAAALALVVACARPPTAPTMDEPGARTEAYPDDDGGADACAAAGRVLWALRCREAGRTVGITFPAFCRSRWPAIDAECIQAQRSRAGLRACFVRCLPEEPDARTR